MPMIDVVLPAGLIPAEQHRALGAGLSTAVLEAERAPLAEPFLSNTAVYVHELPAAAVQTAAEAQAPAVRVTVTTPPGALDRDGQRALVAAATQRVAEAAGDPAVAARTWVILTEAAEGGWGIAGHALGQAEFAALAQQRRGAAA